MVEGEDEDDFGELYLDVLQPFSSQNGTCSGNVEREEKEDDVGSVRLEIYLGSRRVLEKSFVFSLGKKKKKKNGNDDHDYSKCEMVGRRRDELYSSDPPQHDSEPAEPERDAEAGRIISPDRRPLLSGSEEGELISDGYTNKAAHLQNTRHLETSVRPIVNRTYPYLSSTSLFDLDLESLEYRPWRHTSMMDLSHYFNYGLNETSWKIYCHQLRIYAGKQIQGEEDEPTTATIQSVAPEQNKCYRTFLQGSNQQQDNNSKRPKLVKDESGRESWSNISYNNKWMRRNVGTKDSWFHPIRHHHHQEEESDRKKSSRKGRSKLERWTRHDREDENTSTSTS